MSNTTRPQGEKNAEKQRFSAILDGFLRKNRIVLLVALVVLLVGIAGIAIVSGVTSAQKNSSTIRVEKLTDDLDAWSNEKDATKKADAEKALVASLKEVTTRWPRQFASIRAYTMLARIAEANKDFAEMEKDWWAIYASFPASFAAPVALQNAAAAAEERGANAEAIAHYRVVVDKYSTKSVGVAHALFAIGRLSEESKDYAAATDSYQKLLATYPDDDWTKLAKDRIIFLKAHGFSK